MIAMASDCLVFQMAGGENVPYSADMISVELMGETAQWFEPDFVRQAAKAVFHYFKYEKGRQTVTVAEFTEALEKALRGFRPPPPTPPTPPELRMAQSDLGVLAQESGPGGELFFFPRLRHELRHQLHQQPRALRFHGLQGCVKQLIGVRRWSARCLALEDQIISYLRECLRTEGEGSQLAMLID